MSSYQMSFDDMEKQKLIESEPTRYAFIDECGSYGFDFTKENTSEYFILCAVIVKSAEKDKISAQIDHIRKLNFSGSEMKSKNIGDSDRRRMKILTELLQLDFRVQLFIANKKDFYNSALTDYKQVFYKYMHKALYNSLYIVYPKLKIYADEIGDDDFRNGFKKYVISNRPKFNLFNDYDFDFTDSKDNNLVQLADIIAGSVMRAKTVPNAPNYIEIIKGKIQHIDYFPNKDLPSLDTPQAVEKFNESIYTLAVTLAKEYIEKYAKTDEMDKRLRVGFLRILLFEVQNVNPFQYVTSVQILTQLSEYANYKVSRDYLYRQIVAPLRDEKIIISSCSQGYKIPVNVDDIFAYLNQTNSIVSPMLHRIGICRDLIKQRTDNSLDILDFDVFQKYKRFFD